MRWLLIMAIAPVLISLGLNAAWADEQTVTLQVDKISSCPGCAYIVKQTLANVEGVIEVDVSYPSETVVVTFDDDKASIAIMTTATAGAGFPARPVD